MNKSQLQLLIDAYLDEEMSGSQMQQLEALLRDPEAMAQFVQQTHLHRQLRDGFAAERHQSAVGEEFAFGDRLAAAKDSGGHRAVSLPPRNPVVRFFTQPTPLSITVAALVVGLLIGGMAVMLPPVYRNLAQSRHGVDGNSPAAFVAQLTRTHEAVWAEGQADLHAGARLPAGRRLVLESGLAEVTFHSGARLVLEGPIALEVTGAMSGSLRHGKVRAIVPPQAIGFAVSTPVSVVTDLGTEFGVEYVDESTMSVHVFRGSVQVAFESRSNVPRQVTTLRAGDALALRGGRLREEQQAADSSRFRRSVPTTRSIAVENPSFEADGVNCNVGRLPYGWTQRGVGASGQGCEDHVTNGNFTAGAKGHFVGFVNAEPNSGADSFPALVQATYHRAIAGATYQLKVAVGRRNDADVEPRNWPPTKWGIGLYDAETGEELAARSGEIAESGRMSAYTVQWRANDSDAGRRLQIRLFNPDKQFVGQANFDDVQLLETDAEKETVETQTSP